MLYEVITKNSDLDNPMEMKTPDDELQKAGDSQEESTDQLEKNNRKKSSGSQKNAADEMNKAA